jgi:sugar/nucleoside kinase (ribokinase family)
MAPLICTLGDLLLDVVVTGQGPVEKAADTYSQVTVCAGGQAANVAAWAAALGARARLVAKRVDDPAGRVLAAEMAARGVEVVGPEVAPGTCARTGVVVSLSGFDGERSMLTDRGASPALSADELQAGWFECCDWLHLPLYSLVDAPIRGAALAARRHASRVSLDLSSVTVARALAKGEAEQLLGLVQPDIVFATKLEASMVDLSMVPTVVEKLGRDGALVNGRLFAAPPAEVVDTTGAGDAFAAGFLVGGPELALATAAKAVSLRGAMPPVGEGAEYRQGGLLPKSALSGQEVAAT